MWGGGIHHNNLCKGESYAGEKKWVRICLEAGLTGLTDGLDVRGKEKGEVNDDP